MCGFAILVLLLIMEHKIELIVVGSIIILYLIYFLGGFCRTCCHTYLYSHIKDSIVTRQSGLNNRIRNHSNQKNIQDRQNQLPRVRYKNIENSSSVANSTEDDPNGRLAAKNPEMSGKELD